MLAGRIDAPDGEARAYALFAHCFTCGKDLRSAGWISRTLAERGISVFRFDFTGLGESEGDFSGTSFSSNLDDLVAAADHMRREGRAAKLLVGHSLGGAACLAAAHRIPEAKAVCTIAAPSDTLQLRDRLVLRNPELEARGEAEVTLGGRPFRVRKQLLDDLEQHRLDGRIRDLGRALLILHSPADTVVDIEHARRIFEAARHPKSFVSLAGADHLLLSDERHARYVGEVLAAWASRYLEE